MIIHLSPISNIQHQLLDLILLGRLPPRLARIIHVHEVLHVLRGFVELEALPRLPAADVVADLGVVVYIAVHGFVRVVQAIGGLGAAGGEAVEEDFGFGGDGAGDDAAHFGGWGVFWSGCGEGVKTGGEDFGRVCAGMSWEEGGLGTLLYVCWRKRAGKIGLRPEQPW